MSEAVSELTDANFDEQVIKSQVPVLADLWAEWCGPCRMIAPVIEQLATEYAGKVKFGKLNIDNNRATAMKFNITHIPTLLLFKGGKLARMIVGPRGKMDIKKALDEALT